MKKRLLSGGAIVFVIAQLSAAGLTPVEQKIIGLIDQRRDAAVDLLARAVNIPSATENHAGVRRVGDLFAAELKALGFETTWVDQQSVGRGGHLVAEHHGTNGPRLLVIGHIDTVLQAEPFRREGTRGYGSGIADMKSGDVVAIEALRALHDAGRLENRQVILVFTGDEEDTGQPYETSRAALVDAARRSDVALAFEPCNPGTAVIGRRGFSSWRVEVSGSQGHSSGIFGVERGGGAIFEAARILSTFYTGLREPNLTFNPSLVAGGTDLTFDPAQFTAKATGKTNVVPKAAVIEGDLRFLSADQLQKTRQKMREIVAANLPKTSATITFEEGMPSMEPTEGNRRLLALLDQASRDMGAGPIGVDDPANRGAGDISFVAALVSGLDGLGGLGDNNHAPGEWADLDGLTVITKRAALLMNRIWGEDGKR